MNGGKKVNINLFQIMFFRSTVFCGKFLYVMNEEQSFVHFIIVVFFATLWTMIINVAIGLQHFKRQNNNFRAAIFHVFHAMKVGIWVAWFTVIATEMLAGSKGLGFLAWNGYKAGNPRYIIDSLLYIAIIGVLLDQLLDFTGNILSQIVADKNKTPKS